MIYYLAVKAYHERQVQIIARAEQYRLMGLGWSLDAQEYVRQYNAEVEVLSRYKAWHAAFCPCNKRLN